MSDPLTAIAIGGTVLGGLTSAEGSAEAGNAAYQSAYYRAQVQENNAKVATANAKDATMRGEVDAGRVDQQARQVLGRQRASAAASGQVVDTGSSGAISGDTVQLAEADANTVRRNAERTALGFLTQASNFTSDAQLERMGGDNAASAGQLQGFATLLSTGGKAFGQYRSFKGG